MTAERQARPSPMNDARTVLLDVNRDREPSSDANFVMRPRGAKFAIKAQQELILLFQRRVRRRQPRDRNPVGRAADIVEPEIGRAHV